ncbi:MAG: hypothetical protein ACYC7L_13845 [Nitrospirota bacterium]
MKIPAKYTIALAAAMALTLAFGIAYAADDEHSFMNTKDTGTEIYDAARGHVFVKGSAAGGVRMEAAPRTEVYTSDEIPFMNTKDTGTEIYEAFLKHKADVAMGSAAGGTRDKGVDRSGEYTNDELPGFSREIPTW